MLTALGMVAGEQIGKDLPTRFSHPSAAGTKADFLLRRPVLAVKQALARANWKIGDVDRFEINEAFAAIAIAVYRELGLA